MPLFLGSVFGLLGLFILFLLYDLASPVYRVELWWFARATSEQSWEKFCSEVKYLTVGKQGYPLWYQENEVSQTQCEQGNAIISQPVREMEKECFNLAECDPNGRFMQLMWQIEQKKPPPVRRAANGVIELTDVAD